MRRSQSFKECQGNVLSRGNSMSKGTEVWAFCSMLGRSETPPKATV